MKKITTNDGIEMMMHEKMSGADTSTKLFGIVQKRERKRITVEHLVYLYGWRMIEGTIEWGSLRQNQYWNYSIIKSVGSCYG